MEKIKWSEEVTNKEFLDRIGERRTFPNIILLIKANWIGHILVISCHGEIGFNAGNWVDSAQDRNYWRALVNTALNLRVQ